MYQQRPPQRPGQQRHSRLTPDEYRRRQEYYRRQKQRRMQRRVATLAIAVAFILLTIITIAVALHRNTQNTGADIPDTSASLAAVTTTAEAVQTKAPVPVSNKITVCIDPGHGYDDPGTESEYLGDFAEKDVTLAISLKLRDMLVAQGYTVIMTHEDNIPPASAAPGEQYLFGLAKRTEFANSKNPDFYLSIHCDSYDGDSSVNGIRIYYQTLTGKNNDAIEATAQCFADGLSLALPDAKAPSLKAMADESAYYVLRNVTMPAVLVEVGFVTNPDDAANMIDDAWQISVAEGLAKGLELYFQ